jgi:hypothetical protein
MLEEDFEPINRLKTFACCYFTKIPLEVSSTAETPARLAYLKGECMV